MLSNIIIDIETARPEIELMRPRFEACFKVNGNVKKEETIAKKKEEAWAEYVEKSTLGYAAPIITVGIKVPRKRPQVLMVTDQTFTIDNGDVFCYPDQASMLISLGEITAHCVGDETVLAGHNIKFFDIRKLRCAYSAKGLPLPPWLGFSPSGKCVQPIFDSMKVFEDQYRLGDNDKKTMHSVRDLCTFFDISCHKAEMSGADVPLYYESGRHKEIAEYCANDVLVEFEIFCRMTGYQEPGYGHQQPNLVSAQPFQSAASAVPTPNPLAAWANPVQ